jgi:hypothetical protein
MNESDLTQDDRLAIIRLYRHGKYYYPDQAEERNISYESLLKLEEESWTMRFPQPGYDAEGEIWMLAPRGVMVARDYNRRLFKDQEISGSNRSSRTWTSASKL